MSQNCEMYRVCGNALTARCGKCNTVGYCSRECQVSDWKNHRQSCRAPTSAVSVVNLNLAKVTEMLRDSIMIFASATETEVPCSVVVSLGDSTGEFANTGIHFANLSAEPLPASAAPRHCVEVIIRLSDSVRRISLAKPADFTLLGKKYPHEISDVSQAEWSILYTVA